MAIAAAAKLVLSQSEIGQKVKRLAYQIYEHNFEEKTLYLAGIHPKGAQLAGLLATELRNFPELDIKLLTVSLDKDAKNQCNVELSIPAEELNNQVVVLVDDVLNSGRTLAFALQPFLEKPLRRLETAILIDRGYPKFPIMATYVGYSLSTTLQEHVEVVFENDQPVAVYLR